MKPPMHATRMNLLPPLIAALALAGALAMPALSSAAKPAAKPGSGGGGRRNDAAAKAAFLAAAPVFVHPRCVSCHAPGDAPRQGINSHLHAQYVRRGEEGRGKYAMKCAACHMTHNLPGEHLPPGAPGWKLPPAATPMAWLGKSPGDICRQLKDPALNGRKSLAQIVSFVQTAPVVKWGWDPGPGRAPAPGTQAEFVKQISTWAANGAACPE